MANGPVGKLTKVALVFPEVKTKSDPVELGVAEREKLWKEFLQKLPQGVALGGEGKQRHQEVVTYTQITSGTEYTIQKRNLVEGINIFGVNVPNAITIYLPQTLASTKLIYINDESGAADSNNISVDIAS